MTVAGALAWPKAVVFDLDGTLVDSLPDIAGALGDLMASRGLPAHGAKAVAGMIGHGVANLVERAFAAHGVALTPERAAEEVEAFLALYEPRATRETRLFPGVTEAVAGLAAAGLRLAVCTNKPTAVSREMVAAFGLAAHLPVVVGGDWGPPRKPAPDLLLTALALLGVPAEDAVMVGDSGADVAAAKAAGVKVVAVEYGYTPVAPHDLGADAVIADFGALRAALEGLREAV